MRFIFLTVLFLFSTFAKSEVIEVHPKDLAKYIPEWKLKAIIGGREAQPGEFPSTFQIRGSEDGSNFLCTGTMIGPHTLQTAAHCVGDTNWFFVDGQKINLACEVEPHKVDGALCVSDRVVDVKYAVIPTGRKVLVGECKDEVGFGATNRDGSGGNDGIQRVGDNICVFTTSGQEYRSRNAKRTVLGPGDSGGPSFFDLSNPHLEIQYADGIHSAVLVDTETDEILDVSIMVDNTDTRMQAFIKDFAEAKNVEICGINLECNEGDEPAPPTDPCALERQALDLAVLAYDKAVAEFDLCRQENSIWKCRDEFKATLKAALAKAVAEQKLKRCEKRHGLSESDS
jgi:hypothetical protein